MKRFFIILITILIAMACGEGAKSGLGESCTKTADCEDGLKCIFMVCSDGNEDTDNNNDSDVNDDSDDVKTPCKSMNDCQKDEYCDLDNPVEEYGSLIYYCADRPLCTTTEDCPIGWKCWTSEGFCITTDEAEEIICASDADCVVEPNTKCNLSTGECYDPNN